MSKQAIETRSDEHPPSLIRMCSYVDRTFADLVEVLAQPGLAGWLHTVAGAAIGDEAVTVVPGTLVRVSDTFAHLPLWWSAAGSDGGEREGRAAIDLIVVRSGSDPSTEVLMTLWDTDASARAVIAHSHRFLDGLTDRLTAATRRSDQADLGPRGAP